MTNPAASVSPAFWVALASTLAMIIGAIGPWARVLGLVSVSGTDGGDGWIVIVAALIVAAALWFGRTGTRPRVYALAVGILAALAAAATVGYDLGSLKSVASDANPGMLFIGNIVSAGWGIYVALIASCAAALATAALWFQLERSPARVVGDAEAERTAGTTSG